MPLRSSSPSPTSLRIAILGVGRIGSTFAFQLARTGQHEVTVVARPGSVRLQQLQLYGAITNVKGEQADVRITDALDEQTSYDLVIVTLLAYQVDAVLPALQRRPVGAEDTEELLQDALVLAAQMLHALGARQDGDG